MDIHAFEMVSPSSLSLKILDLLKCAGITSSYLFHFFFFQNMIYFAI